MDIQFLLDKLKEYNVFSSEQYNKQAFSRNIGLFTQQEQEKLAQARIAIPGMGGVGGVHLMTMVRTGIGRFHLSDFDVYEPANINRQFGARVPDFGRSKMEVMKEQALSVNPFLEIKEFPGGINKNNVDAFLDGVDVVLDSLDFFAFEERRLLFNRARGKGVYVITAGPLGFSSAMLIFAPDKGMGFDEYFNIVKGMKPEEQYLAFALGLAPRATQFKYMDSSKVSFKSRKGPSLNIACQLCSAMAGTEAVRILLNREGIKPVPYYFQFDPYAQKYYKKKLCLGNRHPWQKIKTKVVKQMLDKNAGITPEEPELPNMEAMYGDDGALTPEVMEYIIMAGIQAPSGDNAQPWKFSYNKNEVTLTLNRDADHSFFNVNQMASVISCGAVIENMKLAASKFGLKTDISYYPDTEDKIAACRFTKEDGLKKDELADFIWKRQTNRKLFQTTPVAPGLIDEIKYAVKDIEGTDIHFIISPDKIKEMAGLVSQVDRIRTERKDLHEHLFSMIYFSMDEALAKRDGFYIKNLEAGFDGELFLRATKSWPVMNVANKLGMGRIVAHTAYRGIVNSSGVGLVTTKGLTRDDYLNGGRALERVWLMLTRAGYQFQPMAAVSLFFLRKQLEGYKSFSIAHTRMLNKVWLQYQRILSIPDIESKGQVMLFRFGRVEPCRYGTLRFQKKSLIESNL